VIVMKQLPVDEVTNSSFFASTSQVVSPWKHGWAGLIHFYRLKPRQFGLLLFRKVTKIVARCQILRLKCTKFDLGWGSAPDLAGGLTALPRPPS